ncbi:FmdB family zinc ribbon protein [Pseudodesulfovibrio sediminis]|uniref:Putative regulatory protein FmdB zinc ribbon domain-containing protein n=1 Tax=Pseudodesulfovibrio sediminis TaxID=2810563 RepID=A0ABN6EWY3_9BACT|nr:zinc ribbon domain-containing protein [Pseudodesulfovibrio sediminis]BCS89680.1 hypothetical protein PSDVSF_29220 [Pseudodesulfovibrio sediminis]
MPIFEYVCQECKNDFEELLLGQDQQAACPKCGSDKTEKCISACAAKVDGGASGLPSMQNMGSDCFGGG